MDSLNLDHIAAILDVLAQVAHKSNVQWASLAGIVLVGMAAVLRKIRASKVPVASLDPKDLEPEKAVEAKIEVTLEKELDKFLPKK